MTTTVDQHYEAKRWNGTVLNGTYDGGRDAVSLDINGLNQSGLLESSADRSSGSSQCLGATVEAESRRGCSKDGKECKSGDLHGCIGLFVYSKKKLWKTD